MDTSTRWLNDYLEPPLTAAEQADLLTRAGFPLEGGETVEVSDGTDERQDFEMTSNRGDCVCHVGLAREIAAMSGRTTLKMPAADPPATGPAAAGAITVDNREPLLCPLYTARVIRGVTVGPSPEWLADRLRARGDIPRNNVVDATNFVLFELGQPTHVFDLATLRGATIIIRRATAGERFLPLGEGAEPVKLVTDDLVIADAERAVAIAGVKGGAETAVHEGTTDLLLEAATFQPVTVRNTSRRHGITSDSSYRFERGVHPAQIAAAAERLAQLILDLAGGELAEGVVASGAPIPAPIEVRMRPQRCRRILGIDIDDATMVTALDTLGFAPRAEGPELVCTVPPHRLDIAREIDLIEEVARMHGLDEIPVKETMEIRMAPPQADEMARTAVSDTLIGLGFVEAVTHSLIGEALAAPFFPEGTTALHVDDDRAGAEPILKPSIIPGLLRVRRHNQDNGVDDLRLFESAATFRAVGGGHDERVRLGLLMDVDDLGDGLRPIRGVTERLARLLAGRDATVTVTPDDSLGWLDPGAAVAIDGRPVGHMGLLAAKAAAVVDLGRPVLAAELELESFYADFPPDAEAVALPSFPSIERDLSAVVDEDRAWADLETAVRGVDAAHLEDVAFIGAFRGKPIPDGRKSVTLRMCFRAPDRTLTHDEIDPAIDRAIAALESAGAEIRR